MERTHLPEAVTGTRFRTSWLAQTTSTNTVAAQAAAAGEPEGLVIAAGHQTAGRGRLGRTWSAPAGSALLCSFVLRAPRGALHLAVSAVACAAAAACGRARGFEPDLKWPNDLVVERDGSWRKLAGILAEAVTDGERVHAVVVGLGLNVVRAPDFPAELEAIATSLDQLVPDAPNPRELLGLVCEELEPRCDLLAGRPAALMAEYRRRCVTIGQHVSVEQAGEIWEGRAVDVADDGSLQVLTASGVRRVEAGDVTHLRPA